jgi:hypothetical protein
MKEEKYTGDYIKGFIDALELVVRQFRMITILDDDKLPNGVNVLKDKSHQTKQGVIGES